MSNTCSRRLFLLGTATSLAGVLAAACSNSESGEEVAASEVPVGSAIILGSYIIAQPHEGEYKAYSTLCPHARHYIDKVLGDKVKCPGHGSEFSIVDGSVLKGPARDPLTEATIESEGDTLAVS